MLAMLAWEGARKRAVTSAREVDPDTRRALPSGEPEAPVPVLPSTPLLVERRGLAPEARREGDADPSSCMDTAALLSGTAPTDREGLCPPPPP